jgi:hypothetical protein
VKLYSPLFGLTKQRLKEKKKKPNMMGLSSGKLLFFTVLNSKKKNTL